MPPVVLFLSLTWSEAGDEAGAAYLPEQPAAKAMAFLQRSFLGSPLQAEEAREALGRGEVEALFCWASEADAWIGRGQSRGRPFHVLPLPHRGPYAVAPFGGWTVVCPAEGAGKGRRWWILRRQGALEAALRRAGFASVERTPSPASSPGERALGATRFRALPFTAKELEILDQAVADAVEAGIAPEQALRRAKARLAVGRSASP